MNWKRKLNKRDLKHLKETTNACTQWELKNNIRQQRKDNSPCWECEDIARKLDLRIEE